MKISLLNYRVPDSAAIEFVPITLVTSPNEGGKTSLRQPVTSVILGKAVVLKNLKVFESALVRVGSFKALIMIGAEGGKQTVVPCVLVRTRIEVDACDGTERGHRSAVRMRQGATDQRRPRGRAARRIGRTYR